MAESQLPTLISISGATASGLQGANQYWMGLVSGYLIDWTFIHWELADDQLFLRLVKLSTQAAVNGVVLNYLLPWIHPNVEGYRDPTSGYCLAFGLIHGQPRFSADAKLLTSSLLEVYEEKFLGKKDSTLLVSDNDQTEAPATPIYEQ